MLERLTTSHHFRRLRKVGWAEAMVSKPGLWADGDPPPRSGNSLEVLIDGADALKRIAEELRSARSSVHLTGWHVTPEFPLVRGDEPAILRDILADLSSRIPVRMLIWAGAPVPLLRPWRGDVRKVREALCAGNRIQCALDARERPMHCHHEKTVVIDGRVAFVGGIEISNSFTELNDPDEKGPRPPARHDGTGADPGAARHRPHRAGVRPRAAGRVRRLRHLTRCSGCRSGWLAPLIGGAVGGVLGLVVDVLGGPPRVVRRLGPLGAQRHVSGEVVA